MRNWFLVGMGILVALSAFGCSTQPVVKVGDPNDPNFQTAKPELEQALASGLGGMDLAWDEAQSPSDTVNPLRPFGRGVHQAGATVDTFAYSYDTTGWHVAYAAASQNGLTVTILDSVRLQNLAGDPQQDWDSLSTDFVHSIIHVSLTADDTLTESGTATLDYNYTFAGITGGTVTASGNHAFHFNASFADTSGSCDFAINLSQEAMDVTFEAPASEVDGVCPTGGTVSAVESLDLACNDGQNSFAIAGDWSIQALFNGDGTASVEAISDNTQWNFTTAIDCVNYENPLGTQ